MAEGIINHYLGDEWQAYSAGTEPAGYVHPLAIIAMSEIGIDISGHVSKSTDQFRDKESRLTGVCARCCYAERCRAGCTAIAYSATGSIGCNPYCIRSLESEEILADVGGL